MSDPTFAGVVTLGRIRDLYKYKLATEIVSNRKKVINFLIYENYECDKESI